MTTPNDMSEAAEVVAMNSDERQIKILQKFLDASEAAEKYAWRGDHEGKSRTGVIKKEAFIAGATWAKSQAASEVEAAQNEASYCPNEEWECVKILRQSVSQARKEERERCADLVRTAFEASVVEPLANLVAKKILSRPSREGE